MLSTGVCLRARVCVGVCVGGVGKRFFAAYKAVKVRFYPELIRKSPLQAEPVLPRFLSKLVTWTLQKPVFFFL